jgi:hypothetical protein
MCRFSVGILSQWWLATATRIIRTTGQRHGKKARDRRQNSDPVLLCRLEHFFLNLFDQAAKLLRIQTDSMLSVPSFVSSDMPIRHPAELLSIGCLKYDEEGIIRHFLLSFSQPRFELSRKQRGNDIEVPVSSAKLKIEIHVQIRSAPASRTRFRSALGKVVQTIEQFLVRGIFLVTLSAVEILRRHV